MVLIKDILAYLKSNGQEYVFNGKEDIQVETFSSLAHYKHGSITWAKNQELADAYCNSDEILLAVLQCGVRIDANNTIVVNNSKEVFFSIIEHFFDNREIAPDIGENTYLSPKVQIGKNVKIGSNCVLDGDIIIGDDTIIYNNITMIHHVLIGKRCIIQSGTIIGHDDFGYYEDAAHKKTMIKHYGGVTIGDDVFIGAACIINRGTIDDTIIGDGVKMDALCHVSHNTEIGENCALVSGSKLYGSVHLGANVYVASSIIKNQVHIGNNVTIGMNSVVMHDLDDGITVVGTPAKQIKR